MRSKAADCVVFGETGEGEGEEEDEEDGHTSQPCRCMAYTIRVPAGSSSTTKASFATGF